MIDTDIEWCPNCGKQTELYKEYEDAYMCPFCKKKYVIRRYAY